MWIKYKHFLFTPSFFFSIVHHLGHLLCVSLTFWPTFDATCCWGTSFVQV